MSMSISIHIDIDIDIEVYDYGLLIYVLGLCFFLIINTTYQYEYAANNPEYNLL